jgi:hypothetical protein
LRNDARVKGANRARCAAYADRMDSPETYEQLTARLAAEYPTVPRGRIEGILVEEHDLLVGLRPGDIVPFVVAEAVAERLDREVARAGGASVAAIVDADLA